MTWLYLLPNLALFLVLYKMTGVKLHAERPALFVFFSAWLLYSLINVLATAWAATNTPAFARFYFWSSIAVWLSGAVALAAPTSAILARPWLSALVPAALLAAGLLIRALLARLPGDASALALAITCFLAVAAGAVFFLASYAAGATDIVLWRGAGSFFLLFGFGLLTARLLGKSEAANTPVILACTLIWLALAWQVAPRPDALWNLERLGWTGQGISDLSAAADEISKREARDV
jgi:hypothetical protein